MAFSKATFLALFLLSCSLRLGFASDKVYDDPNAETEMIGHKLPYAQDCCGFGRPCSSPPSCGTPPSCGGPPSCGTPPSCGPPSCGGPPKWESPPSCGGSPPSCCGEYGSPCGQTGCGCQQNPSFGCQPAMPPQCPWQGPCPSSSGSRIDTQRESDHPSNEPEPPHNKEN